MFTQDFLSGMLAALVCVLVGFLIGVIWMIWRGGSGDTIIVFGPDDDGGDDDDDGLPEPPVDSWAKDLTKEKV